MDKIPSYSFSACENLAASSRSYGLNGMICSQNQSEHVFPSVATDFALVTSNQQYCDTSPLIGGILVVHEMVATGGEVGIRRPSPGAPFISSIH